MARVIGVRVVDLLAQGPTKSFEFFPPKTDAEQATLEAALAELEPLQPSFVSVTYRGGRSSRERTTNLVAKLARDTSLTPMAHLICVAHTRAELVDILNDFKAAGVVNLLALGGDPPTDEGAEPGELQYAEQLVDLAREIGGFSIGVAAHPEVHPRSPSRAADREQLAAKLQKADFAITQLFFRAEDYAVMVDELRALGVTKPIIAGVMPITNLNNIKRMAELSGAAVPQEVVDRVRAVGEDADAVRAVGVEIATEFCRDLLALGAAGLQFYTLNKSSATREIYKNLGF
ncbi:MAG TPA: methylenetetrahydrofolate reductase [Acidimicrobiales bacterium]|nr:methylenetetrahydrofolate reductase [Acidimicrobiales bacterium]